MICRTDLAGANLSGLRADREKKLKIFLANESVFAKVITVEGNEA